MLAAAELLGDKLPVPTKKSVRRDNCGDLLKDFPAQWFPQLSESSSLSIIKAQSSFELLLEDLVFGFQKINLAPEFFVELA